ncbi:MAG: hypothetical protein ACJ752_04405 [Gaiellaceae bacterium]
MQQTDLPTLFCWTRFGTEAGELIGSILQRKEIERLANGGVFYWGVGNSVAPGIASLLQRVARPKLLFSPIKSRPRSEDVAPQRIVRWREAITIAGDRITLPDTVCVTSRQSRSHYALVCSSTEPLQVATFGRLHVSELRNLESGKPLGSSQVTAVVTHRSDSGAHRDGGYVIALRAFLVEPYFVRLATPCVEVPIEFARRAA